MSRKIKRIFIHCSATPEGRAVTVEEIRGWHRTRGFSDIGYHWVIGLDGTVAKGRDEQTMGAHAQGHNRDTIGVCYIGGLDAHGNAKDTRTDAQKKALVALVDTIRLKHGAGITVHGHNEVAAKACPCFDVRAEFG